MWQKIKGGFIDGIAVKAIKTVVKEEGDNIDGGMLMFLTEALEKIKEIKL